MATRSSSPKLRRRSSISTRSTHSSSRSRSVSKSSSKSHGKKGLLKYLLTFEFAIYAVHLVVFFLYVVPLFGQTVKQKCEGYYGCSRYIKRTVFGYSIDLADGQWRDMRGNFLLLWGTLLLTTAGHWLCSKIWNMRKPNSTIGDMATVSAVFRLVVGAIFLFVLHGRHCLIVFMLAYIGYRITRWQEEAGRLSGWYSWAYVIAVILFKESYRIMHFPSLSFLRPLFNHEQYGGMYRWQLPANFLVLRILSYSIDFLWAADEERSLTLMKSAAGKGEEEEEMKRTKEIERKREIKELTRENIANNSRPMTDYNIVNYLSYVLYTPLYTAGPIITFNAFVENTYHPQKSEDPYVYAGRWLMCLACMEFLSNRFPFFAVISSGLFPYLSPAEMAITAYFTLKMMWLKFLITWRFFRLWAIADGTNAPENMLRCMSNNCSLETFWRGWHASFNKWIVRYMYRPMGGRRTKSYSVWLIFLFVAIWHDIELKLLVWGILNGVFFVVEIAAKKFMKSDMIKSLPASLIQVIIVLAGATYILVLVAVNLTGYAIGVSGVQTVLQKFVTWDGFFTLIVAYYFLCLAVSFMNWISRVRSGITTSSSSSPPSKRS